MTYWDTRHEPIVYYMVHKRHKGAVKIGTTVNTEQRLARYIKNRDGEPYFFLAWERGGPSLESKRHQQFRHLLITGEWFFLAEDLRQHIIGLIENGFTPEPEAKNEH